MTVDLQSELLAARARIAELEARKPRAKPLVWYFKSKDDWQRAETAICAYAMDGRGQIFFAPPDDEFMPLPGADLYDKAAAEADHQARFLAMWEGWE